MSTARFLATLLQEGVQLKAVEDGLGYRAAPGTMSAPLRAAIAEHKGAIREMLGTGRRHARLSFAQQRLWFLDQLEPDSAAYNLPTVAVRAEGPLDAGLLKRCLDELVARHEPLRTTFRAIDGRPFQAIADSGEWPMEFLDLSTRAGGEAEAEAQRRAHDAAERPFDLERGPLVRALLLKTAPLSHVLVLSMHHIVSDGLSIRVLFKELKALHEAFAAGLASPLAPLPVCYSDFAHWQRERLRGPLLDRQVEYWRAKLAGMPPLLELPTDRPRPAVQTFNGSYIAFEVPRETVIGLGAAGKLGGATLYMTLLAVFKTLLWRYTGRDDIVVGTPIAGRIRPELGDLIGFFVNTLVLRTDFSGEPRFIDVVERIRQEAFDAFEHQEVPFEKLVEALQPERSLAHSPLVQAMFVHEPAPEDASAIGDLRLTELKFHAGKAKFDLTMYLRAGNARHNDALKGTLEYNTDLFGRSTIERMVERFLRFAAAAAANPSVRISEMPLASEDERRAVLALGSGETAAVPAACLHELTRDQAILSPDAVAIVCGETRLTHGELERRSNRIAHSLARRGIGPGAVVGICLERSVDAAASILAAWKCGAAYVALDPGFPMARLAYMLDDAAPRALITRTVFRDRFAAFRGEVLDLDGDTEELAHAPTSATPVSVSSGDLAYVVYTSGSTGQPKGVLGLHGPAVNFIEYMLRQWKLNPGDRALQLASLSFDASIRDLFGPLAAGATVIMPSPDDEGMPGRLLGLIRKHDITRILSLVPTVLRTLVDAAKDQSFPSVRTLLVSGEALPLRLCRDAGRVFPNAAVVNQYGPTECTMISTYHRVAEADGTRGTAPLGRPIPNAKIYVLDGWRHVVPPGIPGEIFIGGAGVAPGYLNKPGLTAERFLPDPFVPGARMYRTGDRGMFRPDGTLVFLGRLDNQVKLRGIRIEPGEIESVLMAQPGMRAAIVVVIQDQLTAYVAADDPGGGLEAGLRKALRDRLPPYCVPSAIMILDAFPTTPNGKIDRKALPSPRRPDTGPVSGPPSGPVEEQVAREWCDVLGIPAAGRTDNFLDSGGHSLLAIQLLSRLNEAFGVELPLRAIFEDPTIAGLARRIGGIAPSAPREHLGLSAGAPDVAVRIQGGDGTPLFCLAPAGGTTFPYYALAHHLGATRTVYALQDPASTGTRPPCRTLEEMAEIYIGAMKSIQPQGPYHFAGWSYGGSVAFEVARQLGAQGDEVGMVALIETVAFSESRRYTLRSLSANLNFVASLARSGLGTIVDGAYMMIATVGRRSGGSRRQPLGESLRATWLEQIYGSYLKRAGMAQLVEQNPGLLSIDQPSTVRFVTIARANFKARERYRPEPYGGRLLLFRASEQPETPLNADPFLGWGRWVDPSRIDVRIVEGDHFSIMRSPRAGALADGIREAMARAR